MKKIAAIATTCALALISINVPARTAFAETIKYRSFDSDSPSSYSQDQVNILHKEIESLNSKIERLEKLVIEVKRKVDKVEVETTTAQAQEKIAEPSNEVTQEIPKTQAIAGGSEKQVYDVALSALKSNDLPYAAKQFEKFIDLYPKSSLMSNALFWYGETFFKQKSYDKAALQFLKSYKHAPKGPKASDSLLKLATSLADLKKNNEACGILNKLDTEFSTRSEASMKKSNGLRTQLKCKQ